MNWIITLSSRASLRMICIIYWVVFQRTRQHSSTVFHSLHFLIFFNYINFYIHSFTLEHAFLGKHFPLFFWELRFTEKRKKDVTFYHPCCNVIRTKQAFVENSRTRETLWRDCLTVCIRVIQNIPIRLWEFECGRILTQRIWSLAFFFFLGSNIWRSFFFGQIYGLWPFSKDILASYHNN